MITSFRVAFGECSVSRIRHRDLIIIVKSESFLLAVVESSQFISQFCLITLLTACLEVNMKFLIEMSFQSLGLSLVSTSIYLVVNFKMTMIFSPMLKVS